jgi:hypothetical protein
MPRNQSDRAELVVERNLATAVLALRLALRQAERFIDTSLADDLQTELFALERISLQYATQGRRYKPL